MRGRWLFFIAWCLLFCPGCSFSPAPFLLDGFEGEMNGNTVDFGSSEGTVLTVGASTVQVKEGTQSLQVDYNLKSSGYMWIARGYGLDVKGAAAWTAAPDTIDWKAYNALSVWMYGSNSKGVIAFDVKDAGGELWRCFLDDNFSGWKDITCPFSRFFVRKDWQPDSADKNEVLDFPLNSFQFEPRVPGKGSYYFDGVYLLRVKDSR